jgi:hypothetical protein
MFPLRNASSIALGVAIAAMATTASAQQTPPADRAAAVTALERCTTIQTPADRLACFDQSVAAFQSAEQTGDIIIIDRTRMAMAQRQAFGTDDAPFDILQPAARRPERINSIETTLTSASRTSDGGWIFRLADGTVWDQVGNDTVTFRNREGETVRVRRAALGSYLLVIGRSGAVRVRRD